MNNYIISSHSLTNGHKQQLTSLLGNNLNYLALSELRKVSLKQLIKRLRNLYANNLYIFLHNVNANAFLAPLSLICIISTAKHIKIIYPTFKSKSVKKFHLSFLLFSFIFATLSCWASAIKSYFQIQKIRKQKNKRTQANPQLFFILNQASKSKNILYINSNLFMGSKSGGSVGHIAGIINALHEQNNILNYAATDRNPIINSNVNFVHVRIFKNFGLPEEFNHYRCNQQFIQQLKCYDAQKPDLIYQRLSISNYTGVALSNYFKIPLIIEYNGSEVWAARNWGKKLKFEKLALMSEDICLNSADLIVTVSKVLRDELTSRGINPQKIVFYPNCIDPKIFNTERFSEQEKLALRQQHNIDKNAIVLTFLGTFGAWHGVEHLAQTIRSMVDIHEDWLIKQKVHFLLVGDGIKMTEVKTILNENKYMPYITFTGIVPQEEAPIYLAISDILLSPHVPNADGSKFFGSPTKLFEYMAMSKGIIASNLEQIGEVLNDSIKANNLPNNLLSENSSELAVLTKPGNIDELIKAIIFLVERPNWREKLGKNARNEVLAKYTWDKHVNAILEKL